MSESVDPSIVPASETQNADVQQVQAKVQSPTGAATARTTFVSSLSQLKELDPEVYKATLKSIAQTIINDMNSHNKRLKKLMRDGQRQQ